jgi:hypothetical protein
MYFELDEHNIVIPSTIKSRNHIQTSKLLPARSTAHQLITWDGTDFKIVPNLIGKEYWVSTSTSKKVNIAGFVLPLGATFEPKKEFHNLVDGVWVLDMSQKMGYLFALIETEVEKYINDVVSLNSHITCLNNCSRYIDPTDRRYNLARSFQKYNSKVWDYLEDYSSKVLSGVKRMPALSEVEQLLPKYTHTPDGKEAKAPTNCFKS